MSDRCGSQGWFLSAHQMAQAMHAIMTPDKILPERSLDEMKKGKPPESIPLAVRFADYGDGLQGWHHPGYHPAEKNKGEINTLIIHFNNGLSVGVIVNSPHGRSGQPSGYKGDSIRADLVAAVKAAE